MVWIPFGTWLMRTNCPSVTSKAMNLAFSVLTRAETVVAAVNRIAATVLASGAIAVTILSCGMGPAIMTVGTTQASAIGLSVPATVTAAHARPTVLPDQRRHPFLPGVICAACKRTGHEASSCDMLAIAIFVEKHRNSLSDSEKTAIEDRWIN
jgi:hypothetical protein